MRKRFQAWIQIAAVRPGAHFDVTKDTNDLREAQCWLAAQVARHPESTRYGIIDTYTLEAVHVAGTMTQGG